eukprot:TRINITY_DN1401_c0_g7_i1.p1 TRINITY_DN1401_c0_g7~~TRINITY_DN1401_c0_g7_i1.p1  ORF type:complete len:407 (+),score=106.97 TRINITY_DN1401_c0_g7_i1:80-1300(+)
MDFLRLLFFFTLFLSSFVLSSSQDAPENLSKTSPLSFYLSQSPYLGVADTKQKQYEDARQKGIFRCFSNSQKIPFSRVNDDYCDCDDGSDEPATSACARGTFLCANNGAKSKLIPSTFVGDGKCDCCDGTDEVSRGFVRLKEDGTEEFEAVCPDTCGEVGRKERDEAKHLKFVRLEAKSKKEEWEDVDSDCWSDWKSKTERVKTEFQKKADTFMKNQQRGVYSKAELERVYADLQHQQKEANILLQLKKKDFGTKCQYYHLLSSCSSKPKAPVTSSCFNITVHEKKMKGGSGNPFYSFFEFSFCPFRSVRQKIIAADGEDFTLEESGKKKLRDKTEKWVTLGYFSKIVDKSNSLAMIFENGEPCWGGPPRVVTVKFECGTEEKLLVAEEDGMCIYNLVFSSPLACN